MPNPNVYFRGELMGMLERLREPIPHELISRKDTGSKGYQAEYVNITDLKDLVDDRIGAGNWSSSLREMFQADRQLIMVVEVTVTADDRSCSHVGTGYEFIEDVAYGDTSSNAYAMAFKRAFESFGLGRELWRKTEDHSGGQNSSANRMPSNPLAKSVSELASPKQLGLIRALCRELDIDPDVEVSEIMKLDCKLGELNRRAASVFIEHLKQLQDADPVPIVRRAAAAPVAAPVKSAPVAAAGTKSEPLIDPQQMVDIEIGFTELKLNPGQRKSYLMTVLDLRAAPELKRLTKQQAQQVLDSIGEDVRENT